MFTAYEWFTAVQSLAMAGATGMLWKMRSAIASAVDQADTKKRLGDAENEIQRLRDWRHKEVIAWQQTLETRLEEKYLTRREYEATHSANGDSPWPHNDRRRRTRT